mmetsp:Transcript_2499/g.5030  ORF Transcript_2499/g.5030 Transcript_2499/m.5030 type:complete len:423 (-) Transcript_2499:110-1378(-)
MGQVIAAPLGAIGTCLGACSGSCIAVGCGRLAGSGNLSSQRAARCVLIWLQLFTAAVALLSAATAHKWLPWTCGKLDDVGAGSLGVCECKGSADAQSCWSDQLVYRAELSGFGVFAALLVMTASGCAQGASRSHSVAKFMAVPVLCFALLFVPNAPLNGFGTFATAAAAIFLVAQALLLIDFAYAWNETWHGYAIMAQRRELSERGKKMWLGLILASSAALFVTAVVVSVWLYSAFPGSAGRGINMSALIIAFLLLLVSVTDWCEHGALLTSCVVLMYTVWLVLEALASEPNLPGQKPPVWPGLLLCAGSLAASAMGTELSGSSAGSAALARSAGAAGRAEEGEAETEPPRGEEGAPVTGAEAKDFALHCSVHAAAALYVTSVLAPKAGQPQFVLHAIAIFTALLLYGWSLVAPKILTNRAF